MTNEELKKKIIDILEKAMQPIEYGGDREHAPEVHYPTEEEIADALIAAGLSFEPITFRIVENKPYSYTAGELANWKEDQDRIAKLLHRAEVAEQALTLAEKLGELCAPAKDYIKQAEKELAEEGKNERRNVNV